MTTKLLLIVITIMISGCVNMFWGPSEKPLKKIGFVELEKQYEVVGDVYYVDYGDIFLAPKSTVTNIQKTDENYKPNKLPIGTKITVTEIYKTKHSSINTGNYNSYNIKVRIDEGSYKDDVIEAVSLFRGKDQDYKSIELVKSVN